MNQRRSSAAEHGSAFLLALIIIVLLTILGVSIVLVTETENVLGHTEKTVDRQFYAAESGIWAQLVALVVAGELCKERVAIPIEPDTGLAIPGKQLAYAVQSNQLLSIADSCPAWTDCGEDLPENEQFRSHFLVMAATAQRVGYDAATAYDPNNPATFVSPFESGAGATDHAEDERFNYKPTVGVEVLGQTTLALGVLAGPMRKSLGNSTRSACDVAAADNSSGFRIDPPALPPVSP